ncbi:MAG: hypothetical protein HY262_01150 [Chloroflexi bacterium]|nr:hypothetical protein [Chloroflexota bacterium]
MRLLLHDTGHNARTAWALTLLQDRVIEGIVLSAFDTPRTPLRRHWPASRVVEALQRAGGEVLLDVGTHAVTLPTTNRLDAYDTWELWPGARGDLGSAAGRQAHAERVVARQQDLGLAPIAPTVGIRDPLGPEAQTALDLLDRAQALDPAAIALVIGRPECWAAGLRLDDFVGQLVQREPQRVFLGVLRGSLDYPVSGVVAAEVEGICRTTQSLSLRSQVGVLQADFCGLPAVAAGATDLGTGWYLRQRLLAPDAFRTNTGTRRNSSRITHQGLMAVMKRREAEALLRRDAAMSSRLVPGRLPPDNTLWRHHLERLRAIAVAVGSAGGLTDRVDYLSAAYDTATVDFARARGLLGHLEFDESQWILPYRSGLADFALAEGL